MFEQLFSYPSDFETRDSTRRRPRKGVIIGAGQVGMACAYSMLIQNVLDEMVLVDRNQDKLRGEVMDLVHGLPFVETNVLTLPPVTDKQSSGGFFSQRSHLLRQDCSSHSRGVFSPSVLTL